MKFINHETEFINEGNCDCTHTFIGKKVKLRIFPLRLTQEEICFHCGRYLRTTTKFIKENPFTFESTVKRFTESLEKK